MLRGSIRRVIVDADDVVINRGRKQRLFTGNARQAAQLLTIRCGHRGCDIPAEYCDVDHVNEWSADGERTDQDNALPLCGVHDCWKHQQRLRGRTDIHGQTHLIKPDGTVIKALGARDPIWPDQQPQPDAATFDAPIHTTTWGEHTKHRRTTTPKPGRHPIPDDTVVQLIGLRAS